MVNGNDYNNDNGCSRTKARIRQFYAALTVNVMLICYGMNIGWMTCFSSYLQSPGSKLSVPLRADFSSRLNSAHNMGFVLGIFVWNLIANKYGRKLNGVVIGVMQIIGWTTILFATNGSYLFIGRLILGSSCSGALLNSQIYINEIATAELKESLLCLTFVSGNVGLLLIMCLATFLSYTWCNLTCSLIAAVYVIMYFRLPESPLYLLSQRNVKGAEENLSWYRSSGTSNVKEEVTNLFNVELDESGWTELASSKYLTRIVISVLFLIAYKLSAGILKVLIFHEKFHYDFLFPVFGYTKLFADDCFQLAVFCVLSVFVGRMRTKNWIMYSYAGMLTSSALLLVYFVVNTENVSSWAFHLVILVPTICYYLFSFCLDLNLVLTSFILFAKIFPPCLLANVICVYLALKCFIPLFGLGDMVSVHVINSSPGFVFAFIVALYSSAIILVWKISLDYRSNNGGNSFDVRYLNEGEVITIG